MSDAAVLRQNYLPQLAKIVEVRPVTEREAYFRVELKEPLGHRPGQFVMVSVFGIGEAPISVTCGPREDNILEMVIRRTGRLTNVLHRLVAGDTIGIRGPFGSGFHLEDFHGSDLLFVVGGLGLVPLRSLITPIIGDRRRYGRMTIISGCRTPAHELFRDELQAWGDLDGVSVIRTVDSADSMPWEHRIGLVTDPIAGLDLDVTRTLAVLCGPPVMYKFVLLELHKKHMAYDRVFVDLERRMKCGVGKCGHCQIQHLYCCREGPVFRFSDLLDVPEALQ